MEQKKSSDILYNFNYKNIPGYVSHDIKINRNKSSFIYRLLRSDNMHNLIIDQIKLNDSTNDHFEDLRKSQRHMFERKENAFNWEINNETSLEQKNKDLDRKLVSLYKLHGSKFHKNKDVKLKDDLLHMRINLLKKSEIEKINSKNNNSTSKLRQNIAFKFRFLNRINNNIKSKKRRISKFKKQDEKMRKILKISKSIPDILFKEIIAMKINEDNNTKNIENEKKKNENKLNNTFKGQRYHGNIYDYYKLRIPLCRNNDNNLNNKNSIESTSKTIISNKQNQNNLSLNKTNKLYEEKNRNTINNTKDNSKILISRVLFGKPKKNNINNLNHAFSQ